jgi:hypothetical protein
MRGRVCLRPCGVLRKAVFLAALVAVFVPSAASAATDVMPGVEYSRQVIQTSAGRVVLHVMIAPKPGGLYGLKPVLSNNRITGRERVSAMEQRLSRGATLAGVNADMFNWSTGHPSGIFLRGGVLASRPQRSRSSLGLGTDGLLRVGLVGFWGSYRVDGRVAHPLREFNRPLTLPGIALYTSLYGTRTPARPLAREAIIKRLPAIRPGVAVRATVYALVRGGGHLIPPGGAILQARGTNWKQTLAHDARPGRALTTHVSLKTWWDGVPNGVGGGPALVKDGLAIPDAGESFDSSQLTPRNPRTAVGQLADGRIVFVVADGRSSRSVGLTTRQLAAQMVRLGAVTAMALDSGGSSTLAVDGDVLNRPSDGRERAVSDALMVYYYGVWARKPRYAVFSPNGDGVVDVQRLFAKFVRPTQAHIELLRPDGVVHWQFTGSVSRQTITKDLSSRTLTEGDWRWVVTGVDSQGLPSQMERSFTINNTLGFLSLSKTVMHPDPKRGGRLLVTFKVAHQATVSVTVRRSNGRLVRVLIPAQALSPGRYAARWNAKNQSGRVVRSGTYYIRVVAKNAIGPVTLTKSVLVHRAAP